MNDLISTFFWCVYWYNRLGYTQKKLNGAFPWLAELIKPCFLWSNAVHHDSGPESVSPSLLHGAAACTHGLVRGQEAEDAAMGRGLGHADYQDQILWHSQQGTTNLGLFSSPGLHKTCSISISLNLPFIKGGGSQQASTLLSLEYLIDKYINSKGDK